MGRIVAKVHFGRNALRLAVASEKKWTIAQVDDVNSRSSPTAFAVGSFAGPLQFSSRFFSYKAVNPAAQIRSD